MFFRSDFKTITRSKSVDDYLDDYNDIFEIVTELVESNYNNEQLRLLGVGVSNLIEENNIPKEYNLFTISDKDTKDYVLKNLMKEYQQKYGEKALYFKK